MGQDPIPISALQHWSYCPRQCVLIHVEQQFTENVHTLRGQAVHARVDQPEIEIPLGAFASNARCPAALLKSSPVLLAKNEPLWFRDYAHEPTNG